MSSPVRFREAVAEDIPVLQALSRAIWYACYPNVISTEQIEYMLPRMYGDDVLRREMHREGYHYELVLVEGEPAGYLSWRHDPASASVELSKVYLQPVHHGKGLGQRMLAHVAERARQAGARSIHLRVNKGNAPAIAAYRRGGYTVRDSLVAGIGGGFVMDDFVMEKTLDNGREHAAPKA